MKSSNEILWVEDYPPDIVLAYRLLKQNRVATPVQVAFDGATALDILFSRRAFQRRTALPGIVFLGIRLPKHDGWEVLREIKNSSRTREIPVIMMSGSKLEQDEIMSRELGAAGFLRKPFGADELQRVLNDSGFLRSKSDRP